MVYYLGYYSCEQIRNEERAVSPASENKMGYIISSLVEAVDDEIEVISPAETRKFKFVRGKKQKIQDRVFLKTFASFSSRCRLIRILGHLVTRINLIAYLLATVGAGDRLIVYHSLVYMGLVKLIKRIKRCKLTIEVEELYADVLENKKLREKEIDYLQIGDDYIFVSELLRDEVNKEKKSIVVYGTYKAISDFGFRFQDGKVHIVYAGTLHPAKGVLTAVAVAEFLDRDFVLDILGGGSERDVRALKEKIHEIAPRTECEINYVGLKMGDDFNAYIQACQIGLSPQQADALFNATSFPSKILMYMSNGIKVVSIRLPAIEMSSVGMHIAYYDVQDAKEIAEVIKKVRYVENCDGRSLLDELHKKFVAQLKGLLCG